MQVEGPMPDTCRVATLNERQQPVDARAVTE